MAERRIKSSLYLSMDARAVLDKIQASTGKTKSAIVNDCLMLYDELDVTFRGIIREELERALPGSKSRG